MIQRHRRIHSYELKSDCIIMNNGKGKQNENTGFRRELGVQSTGEVIREYISGWKAHVKRDGTRYDT